MIGLYTSIQSRIAANSNQQHCTVCTPKAICKKEVQIDFKVAILCSIIRTRGPISGDIRSLGVDWRWLFTCVSNEDTKVYRVSSLWTDSFPSLTKLCSPVFDRILNSSWLGSHHMIACFVFEWGQHIAA